MTTFEGKFIGKDLKIAIVVARFNEFITSKLLGGAMDGLVRNEVAEDDIDVYWVPGAFEIPFMTKKIVASGKYDGVITKEVANYALDLLDVDKFGLDHIDRNILITMIEKFQGGPVGLETLAASISEDAGTLEDVYEPYLLKNGFIQRTPRGRVVTELAYQHLGIPREV